MRSGHHAIIDWIFYNLESPKIFVNNCRDREKFHYVVVNELTNKVEKFDLKNLNNFKNIIVNFEHKNLNECKKSNWGKLKQISDPIDIIVLRDPFNWVASSMSKKTFKQPVNIDMSLWEQYANECIDEKEVPGRVVIKFNNWFSSSEYRKKIANKLNISNDESTINILSTRSSFNAREFQNNAQNMKVLDRWEEFKDDKQFLKYISEKNICRLSKKIFEFNPLNN